MFLYGLPHFVAEGSFLNITLEIFQSQLIIFKLFADF